MQPKFASFGGNLEILYWQDINICIPLLVKQKLSPGLVNNKIFPPVRLQSTY